MPCPGFESSQPSSTSPSRLSAMRVAAAVACVLGLAGQPASSSDEAAVSAILAIQADREYGEYLASECLACHQTEGVVPGIPALTGWAADQFVRAMQAYRSGDREHELMQNIASALGDEEIAALATYFVSRP